MKAPSFKILLFLLFFVVALNIFVSLFKDLQMLRLARIATTIFYFGYFLYLKLYKSILFTTVFTLLVLSDIGIFNYENIWFCYLRFISFIVFNIILSYHVFKKSFLKTPNIFILITGLVLSISCLLLVIKLKDILDLNLFGFIHESLYYIYTATTFVLIILSVIYSLSSTTKKSDVFFALVVGFLISDILLMIGYYQDLFLVIQIERFFQVLAITMLLYYVILLSKNKETSNQDFIVKE